MMLAQLMVDCVCQRSCLFPVHSKAN